MTWTDLDRPKSGEALTATYLNGLRNNIKHLIDLYSKSHSAGSHNVSNDPTADQYTSLPHRLIFVEYDSDADNYSISYVGGGAAVAPTITSGGVGRLSITHNMGNADTTETYAVLASPITHQNEGEPLVNVIANVNQSAAGVFDVFLYEVPNSTAEVTANAITFKDCSFACAVYYYDTTGDNPLTFYNMPLLVEGAPIPTEWLSSLVNNIEELQTNFGIFHQMSSGEHIKSISVPASAGVLTYKKSLDPEDNGGWIAEPWSSGVSEGSIKELSADYKDEVTNNDAKLKMAGLPLEQPFSTGTSYATFCTMNVYTHREDYPRVVHPQQYKDNTVFAPRYWDDVITSGGAWRWNIVDDDGDGAPESIAWIRFNKSTQYSTSNASNKVIQTTDIQTPADEDVLSIALLTELQESTVELKKLFEQEHDATTGLHTLQPPGIVGFGRVVVSGGAWVLRPLSDGVASVTSTSAGLSPAALATKGCRLTFTSTFSNFRNFGLIVTPSVDATIGAVAENDYVIPVVNRFDDSTADVYLHSASGSFNPAPVYCRFNFILIGIK